MKIVVIDDDDAVRDSVHALLESYGYEVGERASAGEFFGEPRGWADCLLVDQHMPGMTGIDLLERLRAEGDHTPALMISGRNEPSVALRAEHLGATVLQKPVSDEQLVFWIEQMSRRERRPKQTAVR